VTGFFVACATGFGLALTGCALLVEDAATGFA
jgi:hypothetical protein